MMKKICTLLFACIALPGTLFAGVLWINNLVSATRFYRNLANKTADSIDGIWPTLNWATLDVSTISTFIPFFGGVLISFGLFQLLRGRKQLNPDFPFFPTYDRLNVALGLLGTLWGIIIIGLYPPETRNMEVLLQCLYTAMFSTLIAVVWTMVFLPLAITPWVRRLRNYLQGHNGGANEPEDYLERLLNNLRSVAGELEHFDAGLKSSSAYLEKYQAYTIQIGTLLEQMAGAQQGLLGAVQSLQQENTALRAEFTVKEKRFQEAENMLKHRLQTNDSDLERSRNRIAELESTLESVRAMLKK